MRRALAAALAWYDRSQWPLRLAFAALAAAAATVGLLAPPADGDVAARRVDLTSIADWLEWLWNACSP